MKAALSDSSLLLLVYQYKHCLLSAEKIWADPLILVAIFSMMYEDTFLYISATWFVTIESWALTVIT